MLKYIIVLAVGAAVGKVVQQTVTNWPANHGGVPLTMGDTPVNGTTAGVAAGVVAAVVGVAIVKAV